MLYDLKIRIRHYAHTYYSFVKCAHTYIFTGNPPINNEAILKWRRGNFAPRGTRGNNIRRYLQLSQLRGCYKDASKHPTIYKTAPKTNNPAPNINGTETEKPCIRVMEL